MKKVNHTRNIWDKWIYALVGLMLICTCGGNVFAAVDDFFVQQQISISGQVLGCRTADFNGDGRIDIAVFISDQSGQRFLKIYLQRESERFPPVSSQSILLPSSTNMAQCLDLDGDGKTEIAIVDHTGLRLYRHSGDAFNNRPRNLISVSTVFMGGIHGMILPQDFIHSVSGRLVAFIPIFNGLSSWEYNQGQFKKLGQLNFPHLIYRNSRPMKFFGNQRGAFGMSIPEISIGDDNGDRLDDIYLKWPTRLGIFYQNNNGNFQSDENILFPFQASAEGNLCQSRLIDYDRDGRLDLVCSRSTSGMSGARTDISFFGSDRFKRNKRTETHHISLTDAHGNLIIDNIDRSGGVELIVPTVELGTMSTVKMMLTKKTDLHLLIYPVDNLGRPAKEPTIRRKLTCRLDFEKADPTSDIRLDWSGDFNGDNLPDLVFADGGDQLMFFSGSAGEYLKSKADLVLDITQPDLIKTVNLNGDGRSDLIIIHKPEKQTTRLTLLVTNRIG